MSKEYEKIRLQVHKHYKKEIADLKSIISDKDAYIKLLENKLQDFDKIQGELSKYKLLSSFTEEQIHTLSVLDSLGASSNVIADILKHFTKGL